MFAKGITHGYSPKSEFFKKYCPTAICKKETHVLNSSCSISGFRIYLNKEEEKRGDSFASGSSAKIAWEVACIKWDTISKDEIR